MNDDTKKLACQLASFTSEVRENFEDLSTTTAEIQEQLVEANALLIKVLIQTGLRPEDALDLPDLISERRGSDDQG